MVMCVFEYLHVYHIYKCFTLWSTAATFRPLWASGNPFITHLYAGRAKVLCKTEYIKVDEYILAKKNSFYFSFWINLISREIRTR